MHIRSSPSEPPRDMPQDTTEGDPPVRFPRLRRFFTPRRGISNAEKTSAALLLVATILAIVWANFGNSYVEFWTAEISVQAGDASAELDLRQVVNDVLMTFFFFVVGLEVKKEFTIGDLNLWSRAVVPTLAAVAGLAVPAAIFLLFTLDSDSARAWGIVISSDTAFVLGALAVAGPRFPGHLRVFLLALAVIDDIGALLVIALFYTEHLELIPLLVAILGLLGIALLRYVRMAQGPGYLLCSVLVWCALFASGVQPILAGVAIALLIPAYTPRRREVERTVELWRAFRQSPTPAYARAAAQGFRMTLSVNDRLYASFTPYVSFIVLPLFALANAGVLLTPEALQIALTSPLTWGIIVGLVVGKLVGITATTAAVVALRIGVLAPNLTVGRVAGGAALAGIGFTIALFIADLALPPGLEQSNAKVGVLAASAIAFLLGWAIFRVLDKLHPPGSMSLTLARPVDAARDHIRGPVDAPLTIVEYADFECAFCSKATGSVDEVIAHFGTEVRYVWRHLPLLRFHPNALQAAYASEAAALQGAFRDYGRLLFANQEHLELRDLLDYAERLGLDVVKFEDDMCSSLVVTRVQDDAIDAAAMDVHSTPTFFLNGRRHTGRWDSATLIRELERVVPHHVR
ncbi:MAG TPA: Na+/H+ antiporter NhaA [Glaciibacter sp.]|nr:Na+/H+ antiporter NhaA [Glaciibacter sp.]